MRSSTPRDTRAELLRQVRAWQMMLDRTVVGPVVTLDGRRLLVRDASLDEPENADAPRLDTADGPLWSRRWARSSLGLALRGTWEGGIARPRMPRRRRGHVRAMPTTT